MALNKERESKRSKKINPAAFIFDKMNARRWVCIFYGATWLRQDRARPAPPSYCIFCQKSVAQGLIQLTKFLFAILLLLCLVLLVNPYQLLHTFLNLTLLSITSLLLISVLLIYVSAVKWRICIEMFGEKISSLKLFNLYLIGYFVNLLLPSYIGGDVVRSYYAGRQIGHHQAATATIIERYTGLIALLSLGLIFALFVPQIPTETKLLILLLCFSLCASTIIALSPTILNKLCSFKPLARVKPHLEIIQSGLHLARDNYTLLIKSLSLSFLYHTLTVVNTLVAAYAIGWNTVHFEELFVVLPIILIIGAVPISPNGLGIQEGAFLFFLQQIGARPEQALAIGLLLRAKSYILAVAGWLVWITIKDKHRN